MSLPDPSPFAEALDALGAKSIAPTAMRSAGLSELPAAIRGRALFSAGVQDTSFLERLSQGLEGVLQGQATQDTVRARLKLLADDLTPAEVQKDGRLNLILSTNLDMLRGFGQYAMKQNGAVLDAFPAQEFYRAEYRKEPRNWPERWALAGGEFFPGPADYPAGRMIALVNDPIWIEISAFGLPYAPFDYNSGMDLRLIDRDEAEALGLVKSDADVPEAEPRLLNGGLQASLEDITDLGLRAAADHFLSGMGVARLGPDAVLRFLGGVP